MKRIANKDARRYVLSRVEFQGSNLYARWLPYINATVKDFTEEHKLYVVYSYGEHFPLAVYEDKTMHWYHNTDGYSTSTGKHKSQVGYPGEGKTTDQLLEIISAGGFFEAIDRRMVLAAGTPQFTGRLNPPVPAF
jgi:hypothetical protein